MDSETKIEETTSESEIQETTVESDYICVEVSRVQQTRMFYKVPRNWNPAVHPGKEWLGEARGINYSEWKNGPCQLSKVTKVERKEAEEFGIREIRINSIET